MKNLSVEEQKIHLSEQLIQLEGQFVTCERKLGSFPVNLMAIDQIEQVLDGNPFVDLDFPPENSTIFEFPNQDLFDIVPHWRRPRDFLKNENDEPDYCLYNNIEPNDIK